MGGMGQQGVEFDLGDIFGDMFSRGRSGGRQRKGSDINLDIELTLEEVSKGITKTISLNKNNICAVCKGSAAEPGTSTKTCTSCDGKGKVVKVQATILGQFQTSSTCQTCQGVGTIPETPCKHCKGQGITKEIKDITITIPAGIDNGQMVRITGEGEAVGKNVAAGDLFITVHLKEHDRFVREGDNLKTTVAIPFSKAALGDKIQLTALDGKTLKVKIPSGIQSGKILRIPGKGITYMGDLLVTVVVKTPQKLSRKAKKLLEQLSEEE
jgi:molecular chaperone DnaJ